ncbi:ABC transporter ATP-binding protein/permease [Gammaproteobacteria bacterium]|nr:ABC transporter ATP-binding protein/permease [Gammaproteobacteria bacterium]
MSILEVASLAILGSFIALIGDLSNLQKNFIFLFLQGTSFSASEESFLIFYSVITLIAITISAFFSMFVLWRLTIFGSLVGADLSNRLYHYYLHQSWLFHTSRNSSDLINKISNEANRVTNSVISQYMMLNGKLVMSLIISFALIIFDPIIAILGSLIFISGYFSIYKLAKGRLERNSKTLTNSMKLRFKLMGEGFGGIRDTLLLGRQNLFSKRFQKASYDYFYALATSSIIGFLPRYFMELLAFCSVVLLVLYLLISYSGDPSTILPIISFYAVAGFKLIPAFQQVYFSTTVIRANLSSFESLKEDLSNAPKISPEQTEPKDQYSLKKLNLQQSISLNNISFKYPKSDKDILNNVSFDIPAKEVIGIVGPSGSGKSTLIDLLVGLITPGSGAINVDQTKLDATNIKDWQRNIGFVSQSIFLSDSSIRENIAFGLPANLIEEARIDNVCKMARLEDFINELSDGLDTIVGERGVQLSGGQRQRIGIARALYNKVDVLVFDEATSSLDGLTEKKVMEAIYSLSGQKTVILVAHRLATVKKCNKIFLMHDGSINDEGTFEELKKNNQLFKELSKTS